MAWGGHDGDSSPGTVYLALSYTDGVASWKPQKGVPLEGSSPVLGPRIRREQEVWARHEGPGQHPREGITVSSDMNSFITSSVAVDV